MDYINEFHKAWIERTRQSIASWSKQPASSEEVRQQQERLNRQRAIREGQKEFCAVLTQPYIKAEREATEDEIAEHMQALGFEMDYYDEFHNEEYEIFDAVPNNVLYGIDGALYFIDTQIRLKTNDQDEHVSVK